MSHICPFKGNKKPIKVDNFHHFWVYFLYIEPLLRWRRLDSASFYSLIFKNDTILDEKWRGAVLARCLSFLKIKYKKDIPSFPVYASTVLVTYVDCTLVLYFKSFLFFSVSVAGTFFDFFRAPAYSLISLSSGGQFIIHLQGLVMPLLSCFPPSILAGQNDVSRALQVIGFSSFKLFLYWVPYFWNYFVSIFCLA